MHFDLTLIRHYVDPRWLVEILAFAQVVLIDLVMAGDNALAVGIAASNLPADKRKTAILLGLFGAVIVRVGFVLITLRLFQVVGTGHWPAGCCWRCCGSPSACGATCCTRTSWRTPNITWVHGHRRRYQQWRRAADDETRAQDRPGLGDDPDPGRRRVDACSSNILAVTGAARHHIWVLMFGLLFSIAAMGFAASLIAKVLNRVRWLGYVGVLIVFVVACRMVYEGATQFWLVEQCDTTLKCFPDTLDRTMDWWRHCPDQ